MSDKLKKQAEDSKILEINSGSVLYGTNTKDSDTDYLGIFMPSEEYVYGLKSVKEIDFSLAAKNKDGKKWSVKLNNTYGFVAKFRQTHKI